MVQIMLIRPTEYRARLEEATEHLKRELGPSPEAALCLGSGLGESSARRSSEVGTLAFDQIPHFPVPAVPGHRGQLILEDVQGGKFCRLLGRVHLYEGLSVQDVVFPVRAIALWGVRTFILTNAAGGIGEGLLPGDLMLITDHLNLLGENPLVGTVGDELGDQFPDMSESYSSELMETAELCASELGVGLKRGVYAAVKGPSYETPAEIRMLSSLGADAVGMSTVPEVIALRQMNRGILGISLITNWAAGLHDGELRHEEVLRVAGNSAEMLARLGIKVIERHLLSGAPGSG
jgi:purine-nucleoside phosphorylase